MAPLHLQGRETVVLESFTTRRGKAARASVCLDGFARTAQPRSRGVFCNSKGTDLVILLDFSSLGVLEVMNSKTFLFSRLCGASYCVSHRGLNGVTNCWKMLKKHLLYQNFIVSSGPWGPEGKQTIRNVRTCVQREGRFFRMREKYSPKGSQQS